MFTFRPTRSTLSESIRDKIVAKDLYALLYKIAENSDAFSLSNLYLSYYCYESRLDKVCFIVCTDKFYNKLPNLSAIGFIYEGVI